MQLYPFEGRHGYLQHSVPSLKKLSLHCLILLALTPRKRVFKQGDLCIRPLTDLSKEIVPGSSLNPTHTDPFILQM